MEGRIADLVLARARRDVGASRPLCVYGGLQGSQPVASADPAERGLPKQCQPLENRPRSRDPTTTEREQQDMSGRFAVLGLCGVACVAGGCSSEAREDGPTSAGPPVTTVGATGSEPGGPADENGDDDEGTTGGATEESTDNPDDDDAIFDLPSPGGGDLPLIGEGCQKVDLLFVVDNSESMLGEQENLIGSFPGFIATMRETLVDADSYHVGVTTTDANSGNAGNCRVDGALTTETSGENSSGSVCGPYVSGSSYMTEEDELETTFPCAAQVGTNGIPFERPMDTMRAAVSPAMVGPGACNDGFVRDDALLVVVVITDETDHLQSNVIQNGSQGDPPDWFADVVARKGGIEENIVILSLVGNPPPNECPVDGGEHEGAEHASRIIEFTQMFTHGTVGDVCASGYEQFFADAIAVVDLACEGFTPAG